METDLFLAIDLIGTFAFAISGALAAINRQLDIFGVFVVTFVTACGGGGIRDLCIGSTPPAGLINIEYLSVIFLAIVLCAKFQNILLKLAQPTLFFDAIGLGFFAAFGAHKTYLYIPDAELAILLGTVSAVGGGVIRDIMLGRVPVVLTKEIYASAALLGAIIQVLGEEGWINKHISPWLAILICTLIRILSLKYKWNLPAIKKASDTR
ncbi:trimeric intracellular cation channel family protein [Serratia ureilytica]|uniref:trimeric intracellular cation channel family protein n=1 Tax=Serratia ureilytica TaxID=300181 RepID=UPI001D194C0E|nr:trimeric intracellular cation channel family protein [Serratia ureilytica]MCC4109100.1 trimeric intracellular cation channel family protein [Serratia ureilytica]